MRLLGFGFLPGNDVIEGVQQHLGGQYFRRVQRSLFLADREIAHTQHIEDGVACHLAKRRVADHIKGEN